MSDKTKQVIMTITPDSELQNPIVLAARLIELCGAVILEDEDSEAENICDHLLGCSLGKLSELQNILKYKFTKKKMGVRGIDLEELIDEEQNVMDIVDCAINAVTSDVLRTVFTIEERGPLDMLYDPTYKPDLVLLKVFLPEKPHHRFPNGGHITSARGQGARRQTFVRHQKC